MLFLSFLLLEGCAVKYSPVFCIQQDQIFRENICRLGGLCLADFVAFDKVEKGRLVNIVTWRGTRKNYITRKKIPRTFTSNLYISNRGGYEIKTRPYLRWLSFKTLLFFSCVITNDLAFDRGREAGGRGQKKFLCTLANLEWLLTILHFSFYDIISRTDLKMSRQFLRWEARVWLCKILL